MGRLRKHPPRIKHDPPVPPHLRHTHENRNPNSNLQHLKRDPLNKPYYYYSAGDIAKLFGLSVPTVRKLMKNGTIKNCIRNPNVEAFTRTYRYHPKENKELLVRGEESIAIDQPLLAPAPSVLEFCTYYNEHYLKIKLAKPFMPEILIAAARQYRDDYYPNGVLREVPLSVELGTTDI